MFCKASVQVQSAEHRKSPLAPVYGKARPMLMASLLPRVSLSNRSFSSLASKAPILLPELNVNISNKAKMHFISILPNLIPFTSADLSQSWSSSHVFILSPCTGSHTHQSPTTPPSTHMVYKGRMAFVFSRVPWSTFSLRPWRS